MRWYAAGAVVAAVVLALAYGPGYLGYDAAWALVWGAELADGQLPSYEVSFAPTPHPLANLIAVPLSLVGSDGALQWLTFAAFGALVAGAWALGAEIGGTAGGVVAALLVATRSDLGREAAFGSVDLPFLALVVWAVVAAARRGRAARCRSRSWCRPGCCGPRPGDCQPPRSPGPSWRAANGAPKGLAARARRAGAAAVLRSGCSRRSRSAPALWLLSDLAVTGDPLHSLHGTRDLAAQLERPRGAGTALSSLDDGLRDLAGGFALLAGLAGAGLAVWAGSRRRGADRLRRGRPRRGRLCRDRRRRPARAVPLPARPGDAAARARRRWVGATARRSPVAAGALIVAVLLAASVPATVDDLARARDFTALRAEVHGDLLAVTRAAAFRDAVERCGPVVVPGFRARPFVLLANDADVRVGNLPDGERGVLVTYADELSELVFNLGAPGEATQSAPLDSRPLAENPSWRSYSVC